MSLIVYKIVGYNKSVDYISLEYMREFLDMYRYLYGSNSKVSKILVFSKVLDVRCFILEELDYLRVEVREYQKYMNKVLKKLDHEVYSKDIEFGMDESTSLFLMSLDNLKLEVS